MVGQGRFPEPSFVHWKTEVSQLTSNLVLILFSSSLIAWEYYKDLNYLSKTAPEFPITERRTQPNTFKACHEKMLF
jgi:hypothetical protein